MYGFYGDDKGFNGFCGEDTECMGLMVMIKVLWFMW
jgi:hypothetical protein